LRERTKVECIEVENRGTDKRVRSINHEIRVSSLLFCVKLNKKRYVTEIMVTHIFITFNALQNVIEIYWK